MKAVESGMYSQRNSLTAEDGSDHTDGEYGILKAASRADSIYGDLYYITQRDEMVARVWAKRVHRLIAADYLVATYKAYVAAIDGLLELGAVSTGGTDKSQEREVRTFLYSDKTRTPPVYCTICKLISDGENTELCFRSICDVAKVVRDPRPLRCRLA